MQGHAVYENPDMKELQDAGKSTGSVRFIAHMKEKKLFVFNSDVLHDSAYSTLKREEIIPKEDGEIFDFNIWGVARVAGKYLKYESSDALDYLLQARAALNNYNKKDNWTRRWFKRPLTEIIKESLKDKSTRKSDLLPEMYIASINNPKIYIEIFKNPSKKEMAQANKSSGFIRFLVDIKNKNLYVWGGDGLHYQAADELFKADQLKTADTYTLGTDILIGDGIIENNKIAGYTLTAGRYLDDIQLIRLVLNIDDTWGKRYFNPSLKDWASKELRK
jgi:hypothetical protein